MDTDSRSLLPLTLFVYMRYAFGVGTSEIEAPKRTIRKEIAEGTSEMEAQKRLQKWKRPERCEMYKGRPGRIAKSQPKRICGSSAPKKRHQMIMDGAESCAEGCPLCGRSETLFAAVLRVAFWCVGCSPSRFIA